MLPSRSLVGIRVLFTQKKNCNIPNAKITNEENGTHPKIDDLKFGHIHEHLIKKLWQMPKPKLIFIICEWQKSINNNIISYLQGCFGMIPLVMLCYFQV